MWSILHGIETLPGPAYAAELLAGVATLWAASPEWAELVFLRALRDPDTFRALGDQVPGLQRAELAALTVLLRRVGDENPDVADRASGLLALTT
jgi:hypothetical protein